MQNPIQRSTLHVSQPRPERFRLNDTSYQESWRRKPIKNNQLDWLPRTIRRLLTDGEVVLSVACQIRLLAPLCPDFAIITSRRILLCQRAIMGQLKPDDFLWQDVIDVNVRTYVIGAEIIVQARRRQIDDSFTEVISRLGRLRKEQALGLYATAQKIEQEWREKQRVRKMEEDRAKVGGVHIGSWQNGYGEDSVSSAPNIEERLAQLKRLNELDLLSDSEYEARKAQIIGQV